MASDEAGDDLAGSASTVRSFLLVEATGAWGTQALRATLFEPPVRTWLGSLEARHGVRALLVRRSGRRRDDTAAVTVFAAHATPQGGWLERTELSGHEELPGLDDDVARLGRGERPAWSSYPASLFLTCTHGRHDACCAERGRPVWEAMRQVEPEHSWQVSHVGGDRFAANVIVLPEGLYYGRMEPRDAARLAEAHRRGELLLDRLRGRSSHPFAVQAAEIFLRRAVGLRGGADLVLRDHGREGDLTTAVFTVGERSWSVQVRSRAAEPRQLTCSATRPSRPLQHELVAIG
ncbi:MAG TPA: sucrase ferredoxin [Marmoricola sp.]|nr:sucrase ferredoxin [Marmoricola sp.]